MPYPAYLELAAENRDLKRDIARLRVGVSHLIVHSRAVLACVESGALASAGADVLGYQASQAVADLDATLARAVAGRWRPILPEQIVLSWDRYAKRPLWGEEYLTRERVEAFVASLLHDFRQDDPAEPPSDRPLSQRTPARHELPGAFVLRRRV
jgi:hypothetical protein